MLNFYVRSQPVTEVDGLSIVLMWMLVGISIYVTKVKVRQQRCMCGLSWLVTVVSDFVELHHPFECGGVFPQGFVLSSEPQTRTQYTFQWDLHRCVLHYFLIFDKQHKKWKSNWFVAFAAFCGINTPTPTFPSYQSDITERRIGKRCRGVCCYIVFPS